MKIIVNHFLDPRIVLVPNSGTDKSWVWVAFDFSDGELVETVSTICDSIFFFLSSLQSSRSAEGRVGEEVRHIFLCCCALLKGPINREAIAKRLRRHNKVTANRLRSDCKVTANRLQSD
jgi:hypothetical protein